VAIVSAERSGGQQRILALRDPDARPESELLARAGLSPHEVKIKWKPFLAGDDSLVLKRAQQALRPPADVKLHISDGTVTASGSADEDWIYDAKLLAPAVPGVRSFLCEVQPIPRPPDVYERLMAHAHVIESIELRFRAGSIELLPGQEAELKRAVDEMHELLKIADQDQTGMQVTIEIHAYTDDIGNELYNLKLRESRAKVMRFWLSSAGIDMRYLRPVAPLEFERERSMRAASFRIVITGGHSGRERAR
jgi:outer membrane protein OmpA-like peptidoglycan-associated protein